MINITASAVDSFFEIDTVEYPKNHFGIRYDTDVAGLRLSFTLYNVYDGVQVISSRNYDEIDGVNSWAELTQLLRDLEVMRTDINSETPPLDVNVQDQHTDVVDLFLSNQVQQMVLASNAAIDEILVTVTSGVQPTVGNIVSLKEGSAFYQAKILSSVANLTDWDITLDTPLDFDFTVAAICEEGSINLAVNGSVTPVEFEISPSGLTLGLSWDIVRFLGSIVDATSMDDGKFGGISALNKGVYLRIENGATKNLLNVKTNGGWRLRAFDVEYADKAAAGTYGFGFRKTYGGQSKSGVTLRITGGDRITMVVQDDLTGLDNFNVVVQGHVVMD